MAWSAAQMSLFVFPSIIPTTVVKYDSSFRVSYALSEYVQCLTPDFLQVHVIGALPLRNMSRLWGYVNSLELPIWIRPYGFRLYAFAFGCNLDEVEHDDLREYPSLGAFFYRKLKPGARPVDQAILVSPADGRMLHFGRITESRVEQVKGITYSLDALLGIERPGSPAPQRVAVPHNSDMEVVDDHEFAIVNGIEYSLDQLIGGTSSSTPSSPGTRTPSSSEGSTLVNRSSSSGTATPSDTSDGDDVPKKFGAQTDASVGPENMEETLVHDASVALQMGVKPALEVDVKDGLNRRRSVTSGKHVRPGNALFFSVIYLAPGDYHRYHSPTAWVVEKRRHFVGTFSTINIYLFFLC